MIGAPHSLFTVLSGICDVIFCQHIGHPYQFNYKLFVIAVVPYMWRNLIPHMELSSVYVCVCVCSVCFVRIVLPCPEFIMAALPRPVARILH
jgi:hypothetical protein